MDLTPYIATLREDLATAASAGDEQTRRTAAVLGAALEPAARLAIMNALSELAAEVTTALDDHVVEIRIDGRDVGVSVTRTDAGPHTGATTGPAPDPGGDISRITLRMFEEIKAQAEQAAAQQGVSLNAWLSQAVQDALYGGGPSRRRGSDRHDHGHGHRLRGWVQG